MNDQALQKIEPMPQDMALESRHAGPLDMEPAAFRAGLDRRKENRRALMDWIRSALVQDVDFGRIQTKRGMSKPSLFKPGAEKICGMLGIITTFPTLTEYEQASLKGIEVKSIVLRCSLLDSRGVIVAEGVGARSLAQDYGDLNKALKMAEKSAHIDATLRMAGLSEVFTQDLEDMPPRANIEPERKPANVPQRKPEKPKESQRATEKTRVWFLAEMRKCFSDATLLQWAMDDGPPYALRPDEGLEDWPLDLVPTTKAGLADMVLKCRAFMGVEPTLPPETPQKPAGPPNTSHPPASDAPEVPQSDELPYSDASGDSPQYDENGDEIETVVGKLEMVSEKSGRSSKGPWTRYGLKVGDNWYNTFSKPLGECAKGDKGHTVRICFKHGEKGNDLVSIERAR